MLATGFVPALALIACGYVWIFLWKAAHEVPATLIAAGAALLALGMVAAMTSSINALQPYLDSVVLLVGGPLACYLMVLWRLSVRRGISRPRLLLFGVLGLVLTYALASFTLINVVCGIASAGC